MAAALPEVVVPACDKLQKLTGFRSGLGITKDEENVMDRPRLIKLGEGFYVHVDQIENAFQVDKDSGYIKLKNREYSELYFQKDLKQQLDAATAIDEPTTNKIQQ